MAQGWRPGNVGSPQLPPSILAPSADLVFGRHHCLVGGDHSSITVIDEVRLSSSPLPRATLTLTQTPQRQVLISGQEYELPYSKGLMASRIMATGLAPAKAYQVAQVVEDRLHAGQTSSVPAGQLNDLVVQVLKSEVGDHYATIFASWQMVLQLDVPVVVLLGGSAGVGKSTIATMLATRLGIHRVVPTDAVREVMRAMFSPDLMPSLQGSSYEVGHLLPHPLPDEADPVIIGFGEQASAVAVGIEALLARAAAEGSDLIIEGVHVVPGFVDLARFKGRVVVVPVVITVEDEEQHRSHFTMRAEEMRNRPSERYIDSFINIRKVQRYIQSLASEHEVPVVASYDFDATLAKVIDLVVDRATRAVPSHPPHPDRQPSIVGSKRGAP